MTRRKVVFYNALGNYKWIISPEFNGDKAELERRKSADSCDRNWSDFMEAMDGVDDLLGFLNVVSWMWKSYHSCFPGGNDFPGPKLSFAHNDREMYDATHLMDEVWEVRCGQHGASLMQMDD